jgi:hypothetical protein
MDYDHSKAVEVMTAMLLAGTPIAVWPTPGSTSVAEAELIYDALGGFVRGQRFESLPAIIRDRRSRGADPGPDTPLDGWKPCLLYDDPERPLPDNDYALFPPSDVGA